MDNAYLTKKHKTNVYFNLNSNRFSTHKRSEAVYALHVNAYMDLKPFMRQALYAASQPVALVFIIPEDRTNFKSG